MVAGHRTLNRRCAGCIYGAYADATIKKLSDLDLREGDFHGCHRDEKVRGTKARVCRGFIDQNPLGKHINIVAEDDADEVDRGWEQAQLEFQRRSMCTLAKDVALRVHRGIDEIEVRLDDGAHVETFKVSEL